MAYRNRYAIARTPGVALAPAEPGVGILGIALPSIGTIAQFATGIFSNPKDKERKANADALYEQALRGDTYALAQLRCLSGVGTAADEAVGPFPGCVGGGWATDAAREYGRFKLSELEKRIDIGAALRDIAVKAGIASGDVDPGYIPRTLQPVVSVATSPILWAALGVGAVYFLTRKKGRRS